MRYFIILYLLLIYCSASAQSTMIPLGNYIYPVLQRVQIKSGHYSPTFDAGVKPYSRKAVVQYILDLDSLNRLQDTNKDVHPYWHELNLSKVDQNNLRKILADNAEWSPTHQGFITSKRALWKTFYKDKANLYKVDIPDFFMAVNPLMHLQMGNGGTEDRWDYIATRGAEMRGLIAGKIGFYANFTENQERMPKFMDKRFSNILVPGVGIINILKHGGRDYLKTAGYITFNVTKYINVQFGHGNNFIGEGYRSLLLSNSAPNYLFLRLNTHIWKLNYTNIFAQLSDGRDVHHGLYERVSTKYMALHRLSVDVTPWLNIGLFENIIFSRDGNFEVQYLNPIIFYRAIEKHLGSPDNANLGFDASAIVAHHFEFYTQFLLDELKVKEFFGGRGWWGNKWALQLGVHYIDIFNINNFDIYGEVNIIRPYTYSHGDSVTSSYSHYGQALAHPKGANLIEVAFFAHYQPIPKLNFRLRITTSQQGRDYASSDWGSNILINYEEREQDYGNRLLQGYRDNVFNASLTATYELKHNLYLDLSYLRRRDSGPWADVNGIKNQDCNLFSIGVRWNMARRTYDF